MSSDIWPALVLIIFILATAATILLRPLVKRLADYLEARTHASVSGADAEELSRLREALNSVGGRLALLEERQDFTEKVLERGRRPSAHLVGETPPAPGEPAPAPPDATSRRA